MMTGDWKEAKNRGTKSGSALCPEETTHRQFYHGVFTRCWEKTGKAPAGLTNGLVRAPKSFGHCANHSYYQSLICLVGAV